VSRNGWAVARLEDIPSAAELPGVSVDDYRSALEQRAPHILERWADAGERFKGDHRKAHAVRQFLGVESFGVSAFEAHEGELLVIPHTEAEEGERNEELYLVVDGRARFVCDGEELTLGRGELLFAKPGVRREAVALESPTMLLIVGARPGKAYSPPIWATDYRE